MEARTNLSAVQYFALLLSCLCASAATAQNYPNKPVRIIVPYGAGGPADLYNRFLAQKLSDSMQQPFIVENRTGAGGIIGTDAAAKASPDGYTLLAITNSHTTIESLVPTRPYDLIRDFVPIAPIMESDMVMVVHAALPVRTLRDFIELARKQSGQLNYASSGVGSGYHLGAELLKAMAGIDLVHVPYANSAAGRTDVISGRVQMMLDATATMANHIKGGKVHALATSGRVRSPLLADLPTMAEAGVPGYEATIWLGLVAPARTPAPVIQKLAAEVNRVMTSAEAKAAWSAQGAATMVSSPKEFEAFLREDIVKWAKIVKFSGAKLDAP